jgi:hypothetical protein
VAEIKKYQYYNPKLEETNKNFERHRQVCNEVIYRPINMV